MSKFETVTHVVTSAYIGKFLAI